MKVVNIKRPLGTFRIYVLQDSKGCSVACYRHEITALQSKADVDFGIEKSKCHDDESKLFTLDVGLNNDASMEPVVSGGDNALEQFSDDDWMMDISLPNELCVTLVTQDLTKGPSVDNILIGDVLKVDDNLGKECESVCKGETSVTLLSQKLVTGISSQNVFEPVMKVVSACRTISDEQERKGLCAETVSCGDISNCDISSLNSGEGENTDDINVTSLQLVCSGKSEKEIVEAGLSLNETNTESGVSVKDLDESVKGSDVIFGKNETFPRFVEGVSAEEVNDFIHKQKNPRTLSKTYGHVTLLSNYLKSVHENKAILDLSPSALNEYLMRFFIVVRKRNGEEYEPVSLRSMLGSFERYLRSNRYQDGSFSLINSPVFAGAREALSSKQKALKKMGKGNRPCKADTPTEDEIESLFAHELLGTYTPRSVLNSLWFYNTTLFGMRGGISEHRNLQWGDVRLRNDPIIGEYLELDLERQTKTRTGDDPNNIRKTKPTQHANTDDASRCPVELYKLFRSKRPESMMSEDSPYYIAPVTNVVNPKITDRWFLSQPVGVNKLRSLMKKMKEEAGLDPDRKLTNSSARKHMISKLNSANVAPTNIMQITGHKNVQSITNYSEVTLDQKKEMNMILVGNTSVKSLKSRSESCESQALAVVDGSGDCIDRSNFGHQKDKLSQNENNVAVSKAGIVDVENKVKATTSQMGLFRDCSINSVTIQNYYTSDAVGSCVKRRRVIISSDSDFD